MKKLVVLSFLVVLLAGCFSGTSEPKAKTLADLEIPKIDAGALRLDIADMSAVADFMGRSADELARSGSDLRLLRFKYTDGSVLVFAMKPAAAGGLVLDHYYSE